MINFKKLVTIKLFAVLATSPWAQADGYFSACSVLHAPRPEVSSQQQIQNVLGLQDIPITGKEFLEQFGQEILQRIEKQKQWSTSISSCQNSFEKANCQKILAQEKEKIRKYWPQYRQELALAQTINPDPHGINQPEFWIMTKPNHLVQSSVKIKPSAPEQIQAFRTEFIRRIFKNEIPDSTLKDLLSKKTLLAQSSLEEFERNQDILRVRKQALRNAISVLNQAPMMLFIDDVDMKTENSPNPEQWQKAFAALSEQMNSMSGKVQQALAELEAPGPGQNHLNSFKYLIQLKPQLEVFLQKHPEACVAAENLAEEHLAHENSKMWIQSEIALAGCMLVGFVCMPITLGMSAKELWDSHQKYQNSIQANLLTADKISAEQSPQFQTAIDSKNQMLASASILAVTSGAIIGTSIRKIQETLSTEKVIQQSLTAQIKNSVYARFVHQFPLPEEQKILQKIIQLMEAKGFDQNKIYKIISERSKACVRPLP